MCHVDVGCWDELNTIDPIQTDQRVRKTAISKVREVVRINELNQRLHSTDCSRVEELI